MSPVIQRHMQLLEVSMCSVCFYNVRRIMYVCRSLVVPVTLYPGAACSLTAVAG
jgi:hypothetical protein